MFRNVMGQEFVGPRSVKQAFPRGENPRNGGAALWVSYLIVRL